LFPVRKEGRLDLHLDRPTWCVVEVIDVFLRDYGRMCNSPAFDCFPHDVDVSWIPFPGPYSSRSQRKLVMNPIGRVTECVACLNAFHAFNHSGAL